MPFQIIPSEEISHRVDFSLLCQARGYRDGVEVGVDLGVFSRDLLSRWPACHWLFGVDPYDPYPDFDYDRTGDMLIAAQALAPWHGKFRFVRRKSPDAARWVASVIRPEFVYVDGSHEEADVYADLVAWFDILPDHGCIGGHDHDDDHPGVVRAVERFARERGLVVRLTQETGSPPSFYCYKTEPETLIRQHFQTGEIPNPHHGAGRG